MSILVLDSSAIVAAHVEREVHHDRAQALLQRIKSGEWTRVLLHEYVFLEVVTVLSARRTFALAVQVGDDLLAAQEIEFVSSSEAFLDVWQGFRTQPRGKLSFADSALLTLARIRGASHIATFDKDLLKASGLKDATAPA